MIIQLLKMFFFFSKCFAETLQRLGGKAEVILYEGKTHTDLFLQVQYAGIFEISDCLVVQEPEYCSGKLVIYVRIQ